MQVPVDAQDSEGKIALHHAAAQGHGDALLFLLGSKSNVELKDNAGMTAFLRAVERSQQHIVQMLLQRRVSFASLFQNAKLEIVTRFQARLGTVPPSVSPPWYRSMEYGDG